MLSTLFFWVTIICSGLRTFEKEVYEACKELFKKYTDEVFEKYETPTSEQLDEAEEKALRETAEKFGITPEEVGEIYLRLDASKYQ